MDIGINNFIIAVVTLNNEAHVRSGGSPIIYAKDEDERERVALLIAKTTRGMVHDIGLGTYIIVRH
ncbi:capping complex subunit for YIEGIA [Alkaliphilus serpentinus]|uniref:Uncharacterized protein n=1 Tax=Alkaliphilus serpentinus TaxID=1482731 RepID=A0A833HRE1_9FIRM|nr:hypothetical protein [Alkaliphilus serpentinus]KAB3533169.1 hypothetical protein F8153_01065 [Alkaliphilus serpentinus]